MNLIPDFRRMLGRPDDQVEPDENSVALALGSDFKDEELERKMRRPIVVGSFIVGALFVGLLLWAFLSISGAILAPGVVKVENNSKDIKRLEGGIVRQIFVREGQLVRKGQMLIRFDATQNKAVVDVYQNNVDSARADIARYQAEAANASEVVFPAELTSRAADPRVAMLLASQRALFQTRMMLYRSQASVMRSQAAQLSTQISGMGIQADAINDQAKLVQEELQGVRELSRQGYAPNSRLLALERNAVAVKGQRGSIMSDMARARQSIGQVQLQIAQLEDKHQTEVADGIRKAQDQIAENEPKLGATLQQVQQTEIRAPVTGYVFNLSQFTEGGVATQGQLLMQIVPAHAKMIVAAEISPSDIADVKVGMPARVTLTAYSSRTTPPINGHVTLVSADARSSEKTGKTFFIAEVTITAAELAEAGPDVRLSPGMTASVAVVTGDRTILQYLVQPFTNAMHDAMREK